MGIILCQKKTLKSNGVVLETKNVWEGVVIYLEHGGWVTFCRDKTLGGTFSMENVRGPRFLVENVWQSYVFWDKTCGGGHFFKGFCLFFLYAPPIHLFWFQILIFLCH